MPLPIIADTFRVAFNWSASGQHAANVMHFRDASANAEAVAAHIDAVVTQAMWSTATSSSSVTSLEVTPLDGSSVTFLYPVSGLKWSGNASAGDWIPMAAGMVSLRTARRGRSYRGRVYLPFTAESGVTNGAVNFSLTGWQTAWTNFIANITGSDTHLVVASYTNATAEDVVSAIVETELGTQRRRQSRLR